VAADPAADEVVAARRRRDAVEAALETLPARQRAVLLQCVEGRSYADIAAALDVSEQAVKALVHRARSSLVERLDDGGD